MERTQEDATPAEEWLQSLNATCNRLSTQYLNLLRAASSVAALERGRQQDPRGKYTKDDADTEVRRVVGLVEFCGINIRIFTHN